MEAGDIQRIHTAGLDPKEVALLELVDTLTRHAHRITDKQVQGLRDRGWTDEQIFEAVWVGAAFAYMTRIVDAFGLSWNPTMVNSKALGVQRKDETREVPEPKASE